MRILPVFLFVFFLQNCFLKFSGFAGRNKNGKKNDLQTRALDLVRIRSTPLQSKIRDLYKACVESQAAEEMMGPNGMPMGSNGQPMNPYAGLAYNNLSQLMSLGNAYGSIQQQSLQGRNPYTSGGAYPTHHSVPGGKNSCIPRVF